MDNEITYEIAVEFYGSPAALARRLGIKPQAIYQWGNEIPELRKYQVAEVIRADKAKAENPEAA